MSTAIKHGLAKIISRVRPELFYYKSSASSRHEIKVRRTADRLEIINHRNRQVIYISVNNAVHLPDMINSFDYYIGSADPISIRRGDKVYQLIDFSTPRLHRVTGFDDFAVLCPSSTEPFTTTRQYLEFAAIANGANVIDLGTYSGLTAIAFSKEAQSTGRVIALEPDPVNYQAAEYNIATHRRVNGLHNVELSPMAVSDRDGEMQMSSEGTMGSALVSIVGNYRGNTVSVECCTLMTLAKRFDLDRVDFVKMDIEGAEMFVIPASGDFLQKYRPRLIIEGHVVRGESSIGPVATFLETLGYSCEIAGQEGLAFQLIKASPPAA